ncbi:MAG TPA: S41 family peptidase [Oscillospiraceae bacterium]|nr:S41 family peptidase [Oscillospiraceae bacterium]
MSKKLSLGVVLSLVAITAAITVSLTYVYATNNFNAKMADVNKRQAMYTKLSEIDQKVRQDYIGKIDDSVLNDGICGGYIAGLSDVNGKYMSAEKYKTYLAGTSGKNIGVGIQTIKDDDGNMEIIEVLPNSPAQKSGMKKGDVIIAIDDKEINRISYGEALNQLDGKAGSTVKFSVLRPAAETTAADTAAKGAAPQAQTQKLTFNVTRAEYQTNTVTSALINGNVGYLRITEFKDETVSSFTKAVADLTSHKAVGLVIDLRNNSGGSVAAMAKVLDVLLPTGNTVSYVDKQGKTTVEFTSDAKQTTLPISVIVNQSTFGAAEIFAADIHDDKKGLIVGEKTAGYGTKNQVLPLSDGSAIILSVANYVTMNGTTFNGAGIGVDIPKALTASQKSLFDRRSLASGDDSQLQAAISALIRQGASVSVIPGTQTVLSASSTASSAASNASKSNLD